MSRFFYCAAGATIFSVRLRRAIIVAAAAATTFSISRYFLVLDNRLKKPETEFHFASASGIVFYQTFAFTLSELSNHL